MGWGKDGVLLTACILGTGQHGSCAWLGFLVQEVPCLSKCRWWWIRNLTWPDFKPPCPLVIHLELKQRAPATLTKLPVFQVLEVLSWPGQWLSLCLRSAEISFWVPTAEFCVCDFCMLVTLLIVKKIPFICLLILLLKLYCQLIFNSYKGWGRAIGIFDLLCSTFSVLVSSLWLYFLGYKKKSQYESKKEGEKNPEFIFVVVKGSQQL